MTTKKMPARKNTKAVKKEVTVVNEQGVEETKPLGRRTPLHKQKPLGIKPRAGYTPRLVNCAPGRVEKLQEAGYTIITDKTRLDYDNRLQVAEGLGDQCKVVVNRNNLKLGDSPYAVWMEQKTEWYEEDQRDKLEATRARQAQIDARQLHKSNPKVYYTSSFDMQDDQ